MFDSFEDNDSSRDSSDWRSDFVEQNMLYEDLEAMDHGYNSFLEWEDAKNNEARAEDLDLEAMEHGYDSYEEWEEAKELGECDDETDSFETSIPAYVSQTPSVNSVYSEKCADGKKEDIETKNRKKLSLEEALSKEEKARQKQLEDRGMTIFAGLVAVLEVVFLILTIYSEKDLRKLIFIACGLLGWIPIMWIVFYFNDKSLDKWKLQMRKKYKIGEFALDPVSGERVYELTASDWELCCEYAKKWQEHYIDRLIQGYIIMLNSDEKAENRFRKLEKQVMEDRNKPGVVIQLQRAEAIWNIAALVEQGVITLEELNGFNPKMIDAIKHILSSNSETNSK